MSGRSSNWARTGRTDALLEPTGQGDTAEDLVGLMIATPAENVRRFKGRVSKLKSSQRFVRWGESAGFARELENLLQDLKAGVVDPRAGAELVAAFYETDKATLGSSDDSSGHVGDVYRHDARILFVAYASQCGDKEWLADLVLGLYRHDDYGVRDALIDCAAEYLPDESIRTTISRLQRLAKEEVEEYKRRHWLRAVESLARQIKDASLFERTRIAAWGGLSTAACVDIARVHLECGDVGSALSWLNRIPQEEHFLASERDGLLLDLYGRLGDQENQAAVAWRIFRRHRSADSLDGLLGVVGDDQRAAVIAGEVHAILKEDALSLSDVEFLIEVGRMAEAEDYLLDRADQLDGDRYWIVLPLAEAMEGEGRSLVATILYRALLDSILSRARSKTYPHGVCYLKVLDRLAPSITGWRDFEDHGAYSERLRREHSRKRSFWSRYG
ncbi:MAG: DUF6880 family protein [Thermoleophilia bacterium]